MGVVESVYAVFDKIIIFRLLFLSGGDFFFPFFMDKAIIILKILFMIIFAM